MNLADTITSSHRMLVRCPSCDHVSCINVYRFGTLRLADVAARLICHQCGGRGAELSPAARIVVSADD